MFTVKDKNGKEKIAGRSRGKVIDNRDPLKRGRIRVDHPALGETAWVPYLRSPGIFTVPEVGDLVYVECDCGFYEYPVTWGLLTKGKDDNIELPEVFKSEIVPRNRGMFTPGGHLFEMHDGVAEPTSDPAKHTEFVTKSGIRWTSRNGHKVAINDADDRIEIRTEDGTYIVLYKPEKQIDINSEGKIFVSAKDLIKLFSDTIIKLEAADQINLNASAMTSETTGNTLIQATGTAYFIGDGTTNVGSPSSPTNVDGAIVKLAGGAVPLVLGTAQFIGTGNLGIPVISSIMSGQATKVIGA